MDQVYQATFSKEPWCHNINVLRQRLFEARRFVLDDHMSAFMQDLALATFLPKNKKLTSLSVGGSTRNLIPYTPLLYKLVEPIRISARLPHRVTWIEFDSDSARKRYTELTGIEFILSNNYPVREGWLLEQHPTYDQAFTAHLITRTTDRISIGRWMIHWVTGNRPAMVVWEKTLMPRDSFSLDGTLESGEDEISGAEILTGLIGYDSYTITADHSKFLEKPKDPPNEFYKNMYEQLFRHCGVLRQIWALLATINDIPVKYGEVRASKGFVTRGSYHKFLDHQTITLTVPEKKDFRVEARKVVAHVRRRLHMVRGHWRKNRYYPPNPMCDHEWEVHDDHKWCNKCHGKSGWITEHERGDPSVGVLITDYKVTH
jgi:hypothetical protein